MLILCWISLSLKILDSIDRWLEKSIEFSQLKLIVAVHSHAAFAILLHKTLSIVKRLSNSFSEKNLSRRSEKNCFIAEMFGRRITSFSGQILSLLGRKRNLMNFEKFIKTLKFP